MRGQVSAVSQVVTIDEAAAIFHRSQAVIRQHCERGNLTWRKAGKRLRGMILVDLASLEAYYGVPAHYPDYLASLDRV